jgi:hypothetical protein
MSGIDGAIKALQDLQNDKHDVARTVGAELDRKRTGIFSAIESNLATIAEELGSDKLAKAISEIKIALASRPEERPAEINIHVPQQKAPDVKVTFTAPPQQAPVFNVPLPAIPQPVMTVIKQSMDYDDELVITVTKRSGYFINEMRVKKIKSF